jgi:hypothetical protein
MMPGDVLEPLLLSLFLLLWVFDDSDALLPLCDLVFDCGWK